jgi:hypothetical protein
MEVVFDNNWRLLVTGCTEDERTLIDENVDGFPNNFVAFFLIRLTKPPFIKRLTTSHLLEGDR